jgi:alkanesulfonate monooxygenase SsuD/methylene tetrahydromethanopterin reductase-like flavin-dependent oxidoreductase (luciferase family)
VRDEIPIALATLGEKSVAMTAEVADAWLPAFFVPERAREVWGNALDAGVGRREAGRAPLEIYAGGPVAIGDGLEHLRDAARARTALYVGGMGAKEQNFYNRVFRQYGYEAEAERIQTLFFEGRRDEAAAAVPEAFLEATSLVGPEGWVRERIAAWREAGVTALHVSFLGETREARVRQCEQLRELMETA